MARSASTQRTPPWAARCKLRAFADLVQLGHFSLLVWSGWLREEQLFLMKSCDRICRSLYTESENALVASNTQGYRCQR